jgi:hypothetical protein
MFSNLDAMTARDATPASSATYSEKQRPSIQYGGSLHYLGFIPAAA